MGKFTYLPHTADEKFVVEADDINDAFATSVTAFYGIMIGDKPVKEDIDKEIVLNAPKLRTLLYDFLNELVFYYDVEDLLLKNVSSLEITKTDKGEYNLNALLSGEKHYNFDLRTEIKNMTYSEMEIEESDSGVKLTVVVDI